MTAGPQVFGFGLHEIAIVILAMLLGGICKGIIGIALPLIGLTVMLLVLEPKLAVAMMVIPIVLTNVQLAFATGLAGASEALSRFWLLIATAMVSIFAVSLYAARIPADVLLIVLGFVVVAFVLLNVSRWKPSIPPHRERLASLVAGGAAGLVGGATSVYGPPLTMFLIAAGVPKHKWATSVGVVFGLSGVPLIAGYLFNGLMTPQIITVSTLACIPAYIGIETMAQCIAVHAGARARVRGFGPPLGFLLGTRLFSSS
ncbi:MAG: TSUP family transporter, partial [Anderseniella sp.]|nr:TSUP family transporter [Anderseniella sp.]